MANVRLRYGKTTFLANLAFLTVGLVFLNLFCDLLLFDDLVVGLIAALVSFLIWLILGLSPFLSSHSLTATELRLTQGWYFKASIPISNISRIQIIERGPMRTGVFFSITEDSLYVTTQRRGIVMVALKRPQRFGFAWWKKARHVYFDTLDEGELMLRLKDLALTPSNPGR